MSNKDAKMWANLLKSLKKIIKRNPTQKTMNKAFKQLLNNKNIKGQVKSVLRKIVNDFLGIFKLNTKHIKMAINFLAKSRF